MYIYIYIYIKEIYYCYAYCYAYYYYYIVFDTSTLKIQTADGGNQKQVGTWLSDDENKADECDQMMLPHFIIRDHLKTFIITVISKHIKDHI